MKSIVTLGGKGSRLKEITGDIPKPIFPIQGRSPLQRICEYLYKNKINNCIWLCGYMYESFVLYAEDMRKKYKLDITVLFEEHPMGECGRLRSFKLNEDSDYIFLSGDLIFDIDLDRALNFHRNNQSDLTLFTHTSTHAYDSDCIIENNQRSIYKYDFKTDIQRTKGSFLGNSGIYIFNGKKFNYSISGLNLSEISVFKDIFPVFKSNNYRVMSYNTSEYIHDIGTPKRFESSTNALRNNLPSSKSYKNKQSCLFLDRDGTLIECLEGEYIIDNSQIKLKIDKIIKIAAISTKYNIVEMITNQPSISMGKIKEQDLILLNGHIINMCMEYGLKIDAVRYCPHHPHSGFEGEILELKRTCFCRKPSPGLLLEAIYEKNISACDSLMIGDSYRDEEAAVSLGIEYKDINEL